MTLLEHLIQSLDEGGHGFDPEGYVVVYLDWDDVHENDHDLKAWWVEAINHAH